MKTYDPWALRCKDPFGALPEGGRAGLTIRPPRAAGFSRAFLTVRAEFSGMSRDIPMTWAGLERDRDLFRGALEAEAGPELLWYHFRLERADGEARYYGVSGWSREEPESFQLTVYEREDGAADWFGGGITYQIFPDRFCRVTIPSPGGMVGNRRVHENWADTPDYLPDGDGTIANRDFFGGSLEGIRQKLPYLRSLSVTTIYLNPIFEAASNHRYDTADYTKTDPMLGTEEDFRRLCADAEELGMRVMLDGVFSHTGSRSVYFNADGFYPGPGAAQSRQSPWYPWYDFQKWPEQYSAWWGIRTLPQVRETEPSYLRYMTAGEDSVARRWLRAGASGWRLDVADELPDEFIRALRRAVREEKPDAAVVGEVWEDGSNKISYGSRRRYLLGGGLNGVTGYPFRNALIAFLKGGDGARFRQAMETIREHYPPFAFYNAMNVLGTHDTPRILTVLGSRKDMSARSRRERAEHRLSPSERKRGMELVKLAALVLYAFPGSPTVYYGDEAGMEGWEDPFNRKGFPWRGEDPDLEVWFRRLGELRARRPSLRRGGLEYLRAEGPLLIFRRFLDGEETVAAVNAGEEPAELSVPWAGPSAADALSGKPITVSGSVAEFRLESRSGMLIVEP